MCHLEHNAVSVATLEAHAAERAELVALGTDELSNSAVAVEAREGLGADDDSHSSLVLNLAKLSSQRHELLDRGGRGQRLRVSVTGHGSNSSDDHGSGHCEDERLRELLSNASKILIYPKEFNFLIGI